MINQNVIGGTVLFVIGLILSFIGVSLFIVGIGFMYDLLFLIAGLVTSIGAFYKLLI